MRRVFWEFWVGETHAAGHDNVRENAVPDDDEFIVGYGPVTGGEVGPNGGYTGVGGFEGLVLQDGNLEVMRDRLGLDIRVLSEELGSWVDLTDLDSSWVCIGTGRITDNDNVAFSKGFATFIPCRL